MLASFAADPMGDQSPLSEYARKNLIQGLRDHPTSLVFLALHREDPIGIAVCFRGFSTFAAKPLINLHDFYVASKARGQGVANRLMNAIEHEARESGCCKITLEVQTNNVNARQLYEKFGFSQITYPSDDGEGGALFLSKSLG